MTLTVAIALFTSPGWRRGFGVVDDGRLRRLATATTALVYSQIIVGAAMRHTEAGLAIPDFPLMLGGLVPNRWDAGIAVHFAHRTGALIVSVSILATAWHVWRRHRAERALMVPAGLLVTLLCVQVTLGAATVLSGLAVWINSLHVVGGALVLTTSLVLTLRSWRTRFADAPAGAPRAVDAGAGRRAGHAAAMALAHDREARA